MSKDPNAHVAAPIPIVLAGQQFILSPLTIRDFKELENYLRMYPVEQIKPQLAGLPPEDRKVLLDHAYADVKKIRIGTPEFDEASQTFNGITYMLWLALRRNKPDLALDVAADLVGQADFAAVTAKVNQAAGFSSDADPTTAGTKTTAIDAR